MNRIQATLAAYRPHFAKDLLASVVVFLVALPLCMGIAIASGLPPAMGLITGIIGGLVVGAIAGSPLQVSGPAAGLAVIVWELVHTHGIGMLGVIVLLAGLIQMAAGALKLGQWFRAVSPSVIYGMLAGIGVLIIGSQFHVMLDDKPKGGGLANLMAIPQAIRDGLLPVDGSTHHLAAGIGLLTIAVMVGWNLFKPRRLKAVPAPLVAVVVAVGVSAALQLPIQYVTVPESLWGSIQWPTLEAFGRMLEPTILGAALALALVASAETLLCATAVDQMHQGPRTKYNQELFAQGVGNSLCGLLGALPMTGVIVRSSANVEAGGKTRMAAIFHGAWILAFVLALPFVLKLIPVAALAAVLVYTGYKLINVENVRQLAAHGKSELAIYLITVAAIVATNLLEGVLIGLALSALKLLVTFSRLETRLAVAPDQSSATLFVTGAATFIGLPKLAASLERVPAGSELHVHFEELAYIDHACLNLLKNWEKQHRVTGGELIVEWSELEHRYRDRRPMRAQAASEVPRTFMNAN
jgi:MFS superfamily sulfate permease-like transporter